jgi:hypothetical protein
MSDTTQDTIPDEEVVVKYGLYKASHACYSGTLRYTLRDSPTETIIVSMVVSTKEDLDEYCGLGWECRGIVDELVCRETGAAHFWAPFPSKTDWFNFVEIGENAENNEPSDIMHDIEEVD